MGVVRNGKVRVFMNVELLGLLVKDHNGLHCFQSNMMKTG